MIATPSSQGWSPPDRAPALRRAAAFLEDSVAARHPHPDRVRRLARDLRTRATQLELGAHANSELDELIDFMQRAYAHRPMAA